jgi:hypothetical protein
MFLQQAWYGLVCYPAALTNALMNYFEKRIAVELRYELSLFVFVFVFVLMKESFVGLMISR